MYWWHWIAWKYFGRTIIRVFTGSEGWMVRILRRAPIGQQYVKYAGVRYLDSLCKYETVAQGVLVLWTGQKGRQ